MGEPRPRLLRLPEAELAAFVTGLAQAGGVDPAQRESLTEVLLWNDAAGRRNHGIERLPVLLARVADGVIRCPAEMAFEALGPSLARLDAGDGLGQHAGRLATDRAVELARAQGIGAVGVKRSAFYGTGAYFADRAARAGMVSLVLSNSFPKVAAPGGIAPALGTNPVAFGAPRPGGPPLLVDFSTAALAGSTLRDAQQDGRALPPGVAIDGDGQPVTSAESARAATLLPAAGAKGFGLALMVEVLAGVLTGAGIGPGVGSLYEGGRPGNSGHFILALDPARFLAADALAERMAELADAVHASAPPGAVRLPGAARARETAESARHGIGIAPGTWAALGALAERLGVARPPLPAPAE